MSVSRVSQRLSLQNGLEVGGLSSDDAVLPRAAGGIVLFADSGVPKYKDASGTVYTFQPVVAPPVTTQVISGNYLAATTDQILLVQNNAPVTITLPDQILFTGGVLHIVDSNWSAKTHPITVIGQGGDQIQNEPTALINRNGITLSLCASLTGWNVV